MDNEGWIKLHRKVFENPIVMKDPEYFIVWIFLLLNASHQKRDVLFNGKRITLMPGQLITGRKKIAEKTGVNENKVTRVLEALKTEQQIEQQTCTKNRLISVLNWDKYQFDEQQIEQQLNNNRTTTEHKQELKNVNKEKNLYNADFSEKAEEIISYLNSVCSTHYRWQTESTKKHIHARLEEGRTVEDFKTVINKKHREWSGTDMAKYLCPDTLFGTKFEKYLNQPDKKAEIKKPNFQNYERQNYNFAELERQLLQN